MRHIVIYRSNQGEQDTMSKEVYDRGLALRKDVLGKEYVEKSIETADDFNRPMQDLTTEYCWGYVWGREGLPRKTRSMLNIAMLSALNRNHELRLHLKGALTNGVTREEIREILLQVAIYCGVPAGVDSFRTAREVFAQIDAEENKGG
jgi:4-carboxymuconolactone decarboxylase